MSAIMEERMKTAMNENAGATAARKRWEDPRIVLERPLLVSAQEGDPGAAPIPGAPKPPGMIGPMGISPSLGGACGDIG